MDKEVKKLVKRLDLSDTIKSVKEVLKDYTLTYETMIPTQYLRDNMQLPYELVRITILERVSIKEYDALFREIVRSTDKRIKYLWIDINTK